MNVMIDDLDYLQVYNHELETFHQFELVENSALEISGMTQLTYRVEMRFPPNPSSDQVIYVLEVYIRDNPTGVQTTVLVNSRQEEDYYDIPVGGTGTMVDGGIARMTIIVYINNGVPSGGTKGQALIKNSDEDFDAKFQDNNPIPNDYIQSLFNN